MFLGSPGAASTQAKKKNIVFWATVLKTLGRVGSGFF